jgi:hypothetical protein
LVAYPGFHLLIAGKEQHSGPVQSLHHQDQDLLAPAFFLQVFRQAGEPVLGSYGTCVDHDSGMNPFGDSGYSGDFELFFDLRYLQPYVSGQIIQVWLQK